VSFSYTGRLVAGSLEFDLDFLKLGGPHVFSSVRRRLDLTFFDFSVR